MSRHVFDSSCLNSEVTRQLQCVTLFLADNFLHSNFSLKDSPSIVVMFLEDISHFKYALNRPQNASHSNFSSTGQSHDSFDARHFLFIRLYSLTWRGKVA